MAAQVPAAVTDFVTVVWQLGGEFVPESSLADGEVVAGGTGVVRSKVAIAEPVAEVAAVLLSFGENAVEMNASEIVYVIC